MPRAIDPSLPAGGLPIDHSPLNRTNFNVIPQDLDLAKILESLIDTIKDAIRDLLFPAILDLTGIDLSVFLPLLDILDLDFSTPEAFLASLFNAIMALPAALIQIVTGVIQQIEDATGIDLSVFLPLWQGLNLSSFTAFWEDLIGNNLSPAGLVTTLTDLADAIYKAILGLIRNPAGDPLADLNNVLRNIPFLNILGIGGPTNIGDALQATWDNWIGGAVGTPGTGAGLADGFNIMNLISSWASLGRNSWDVQSILSNKPFWNGLLPTGVSNIPLPSLHASTPPTFALTQSTATTGFKHIEQSAPIGAVSWTGSGPLTSITGFFVNIYQMAADGVQTLVHESGNILGDVNPALGTNIYSLPTPLASVATETYGVEFAVQGAGTYNILGVQSWQTFDHPTVFPRRLAAVRNSGTSAAPSTIAAGSVTYSANIPFVEFAASAGDYDNHQPITFGPYTTPGTYSLPAASWAGFIEVIALGGGGGGKGGQFASDGRGGSAGAWTTTTLERGVNYTTAPTLTITVGSGGSGGSGNGGNGAASTVEIPGVTVTATGGAGSTSGGALTNVAGASPGNRNYGIPSVTYAGGGVANNYGNPGAAPGGGGAGGNGVILSSGGNGAAGAVWIRFRPGPPLVTGTAGFPYSLPVAFT